MRPYGASDGFGESPPNPIPMIPTTYDAWRRCITYDCGIDLTVAFARGRLAVYEDASLAETRRFAKVYGKDHLDNVVRWLRTEVERQVGAGEAAGA